jgi:hypothetical protein
MAVDLSQLVTVLQSKSQEATAEIAIDQAIVALATQTLAQIQALAQLPALAPASVYILAPVPEPTVDQPS